MEFLNNKDIGLWKCISNTVIGTFVVMMSVFTGCSSLSNQHQLSKQPNPVAIYQIAYHANSKQLSINSINVTPPLAGQNITGKAGVFQVGNAILNGSLVTAPVYIVNNDSVPWTGVEMQAYTVISGNPMVADADLGTGWYTNNPGHEAWGWLFTSGTAGFTIGPGSQSLNKVIGFNATSDFVALVYIYANVPIMSSINPAVGLIGSTVTISGYNFEHLARLHLTVLLQPCKVGQIIPSLQQCLRVQQAVM